MISSVTTTVVAVAFGATLGVAATMLLISLLASKEMLSADSRRRLLELGKRLDVAIWPLLMAFMLIVAVKVLEILA
ncbi:MAG: hypothetical protein RMJ15_07275 [Nitrososphaerota archaeon]|nr:hypothetical protein [Candidatus Bathyarchaeota archaeon]MDW8023518.1 hypothetical protein [Nitrososphaerota archaeon]